MIPHRLGPPAFLPPARVPPRAALGLAAVLALAPLTLAAPARAEPVDTAPRLELSVTGEAAAQPDIAIITLGVESTAKTAAEAMQAQAEAMTAVFEAAAGLGVATTDIETAGLSLSPVYPSRSSSGYSPQEVGYRAANSVAITIRDLAGVGPALDTLVADGANRIDGVHFDLEDRAPLEEAARRAAVAQLAQRRNFYEAAAGLEIGPLLVLREGGGGMGGGPVMRMEMSAATPIAPGDVTARITLSALYALEPED